jgi:hypothetical protein
MKPALLLVVAAFGGVGLAACGGGGQMSRTRHVDDTAVPKGVSAATSALSGDGDEDSVGALVRRRSKPDSDEDADNEGNVYYDWDDAKILAYGHPANTSEERTIISAVERYYTAAIPANGSTVCRLVSTNVASATLREFGQGAGPLALGGRTCPLVMSHLLKRLKLEVSVSGRAPVVGPVRVEGGNAFVLLTFEGSRPSRYTLVRRQGGVWRVNALFDMGLP